MLVFLCTVVVLPKLLKLLELDIWSLSRLMRHLPKLQIGFHNAASRLVLLVYYKSTYYSRRRTVRREGVRVINPIKSEANCGILSFTLGIYLHNSLYHLCGIGVFCFRFEKIYLFKFPRSL